MPCSYPPVHLYTPKNESVTDFYIESLVNNVPAGKFMAAESTGYAGRRAKQTDDTTLRSKQYGNEKTVWSQQRGYPLAASASSATIALANAAATGVSRPLRVDESGIEYVESSGPRADERSNTEARTTVTNKNVNKRRKRVENSNNDPNQCGEQTWSEQELDDVVHSVRRWTYNVTGFENKTVSFR